jgi:hypothetical protein
MTTSVAGRFVAPGQAASGITGQAVVTATSIQQPSARATVTVTVNLNLVPDMKCELLDPRAGLI